MNILPVIFRIVPLFFKDYIQLKWEYFCHIQVLDSASCHYLMPQFVTISFLGRLLEVLWGDAVSWMNYLGKSSPQRTATALPRSCPVGAAGARAGRKGAAAGRGRWQGRAGAATKAATKPNLPHHPRQHRGYRRSLGTRLGYWSWCDVLKW